MRRVILCYAAAIFVILGIALISCDSDDSNTPEKSLAGHWIYQKTIVDIVTSDTTIQKALSDYVINSNTHNYMGYEFKNDRTYYVYQRHNAPIKGIYKMDSRERFLLDDSEGTKNVVMKGTNLYMLKDIKSDVLKELNIDSTKVTKLISIDIFEKGLLTKGSY